jgi:hypothetical protein
VDTSLWDPGSVDRLIDIVEHIGCQVIHDYIVVWNGMQQYIVVCNGILGCFP